MFHLMAAEGMSYCWWQKNRGDGDLTCPSAAFVEFYIEHACFYKGPLVGEQVIAGLVIMELFSHPQYGIKINTTIPE